jgi:uncharacterized membrane protein
MKKYKSLQSWIDDALSDKDKDGAISGLALVYKKPEGGSKEVHGVKLTGRTWEAAKLSDLFIGKAEAFAQDLPGIQRFELQAFYAARREPEATHNFIVNDGEISQGGAARTVKESPDATGLTAQLMRHLERKDERLTSIVETFATVTLQQTQRMQEELNAARAEVNDSYAIVREMMMRERGEQHAMRMKEIELQNSGEQNKQIMKILPALVNTASGKEVFPQATADTVLIEGLAENVDPKSLEALVSMGVLKEEVAAPLILRLNQSRERKRLEEEATKKLPPAKNTNGGIS